MVKHSDFRGVSGRRETRLNTQDSELMTVADFRIPSSCGLNGSLCFHSPKSASGSDGLLMGSFLAARMPLTHLSLSATLVFSFSFPVLSSSLRVIHTQLCLWWAFPSCDIPFMTCNTKASASIFSMGNSQHLWKRILCGWVGCHCYLAPFRDIDYLFVDFYRHLSKLPFIGDLWPIV